MHLLKLRVRVAPFGFIDNGAQRSSARKRDEHEGIGPFPLPDSGAQGGVSFRETTEEGTGWQNDPFRAEGDPRTCRSFAAHPCGLVGRRKMAIDVRDRMNPFSGPGIHNQGVVSPRERSVLGGEAE